MLLQYFFYFRCQRFSLMIASSASLPSLSKYVKNSFSISRDIHSDIIEMSTGESIENRDFALDRKRRILRLLQHFHSAATTFDKCPGLFIEIGTKLRKCFKLTELSKSRRSVPATCFIALICADEPTRDTERPTFSAGRIPL
jgi:hypothetical protein